VNVPSAALGRRADGTFTHAARRALFGASARGRHPASGWLCSLSEGAPALPQNEPVTEDFAARVGALVGVAVAGVQDVGTRHGFRHLTGALADGRAVFIKAAVADGGEAPEAFAAEANGLRWLARAGAVPVPGVLGAEGSTLVIELLPPGEPTPGAARDFGAALARMHAAGANGFGAPWPGYIASLPLDNAPLDTAPLDKAPPDNAPPGSTAPDSTPPGSAPLGNPGEADWGSWYAERRLVPFLRRARDGGALSAADARPVEAVIGRIGELAGPPEPPSRVHGDLWAGNVLWPGGQGALIDPAAHGGHRETDLAMLALFGAPYLDEILRTYDATVPLAEGWRSRVPLHQLHPLLVHACLFGAAYVPQVTAAARQALRV
jgi:fructosamine-3-kinase